ncbi:MAG: FecCD family ABC transporter permease [Anaerolineales bacterium]
MATLSKPQTRPVTTLSIPRVGRCTRLVLMLALALIGLTVIHISVGSVALTPLDVAHVLLGQPAEALHHTIVWELRLPRALIAMTAGAMLGLSGALLQGVTRNPLASPSIIGVVGGAVLAVVLWMAFVSGGADAQRILPLVAMSGGIISGGVVYAVSWQPQRGTSPLRLTLGGVLMASILTALTSLVLLIEQANLGNILHWLIGSLEGRVWAHWSILAPYALVALPLGMLSASIANTLQLGDAVATGLGLPVERARAGLLLVAVVLAAGAVSVVGNIAFIGLIAPHIGRRIVGNDARRLFPFSAVFASGLLLVADILARTVTHAASAYTDSLEGIGNLPVGAVTAALGALFFFWLLIRERRA